MLMKDMPDILLDEVVIRLIEGLRPEKNISFWFSRL